MPRDSSFVVIYGRRRVGKTTLIKEFVKSKCALYFLATEEIESRNRKRFSESLAELTGLSYLKNGRFDNWEDMFRIFISHNKGQKKILVIDEFQYLVNANKAFTSVFQRIWDEVLKDSNIMVILCGSYISMMVTEILSYSSPLYGRRTAQIKLAPLKFLEIRDAFAQIDFKKLVEIYAVTGGVPKYLDFFINNNDFYDNIKNEILSKNGFLYEEPVFLLEKKVRESMTYFSIMQTIADGNHKLSKIAGNLEVPVTSITPYIKTLKELGLVDKRIPVTEKNQKKAEKDFTI
ncbi:MAG: AAA family ATPase [Alkaliphilus sp.]